MSTTLSGSYNTAFNLTISFQSPVTVARTGYFSVASDAAIYGHPGHYWSVLNLGRIYSTDTFSGAGIQLNSSGSVTNGQSGPGEDTAQIRGGLIGVLIDGDTAAVTNFGRIGAGPLTSDTSVYGVQLLGTTVSTVTNGDHGLIYGSSIGVLTQSGPATIVNSGRLAAPEFSGSAVKLTGAGNDSVSNSGAIYGGDGIEIDKGSATITNTGSIFGTGTSSGNGVVLDAGGALYNGLKPFETGYILGRYAGVAASDAPATVVNLDRITGKSAASLGVELSDGGSLVNGSSNDTGASIVGGVGARLGSAGSVTNFGTIKGTSAYVGDGIRLDGFVSNRTVDNASSAALISGTRYGVLSLNPTTLTNFGTIEGTIGASLSAGLNQVPSTVTNAGTITGSSGTALSFGAA
ncbi:MAG TPA: hypothetical protein VFQ82_08625, partial [Stellaceae bacterium]|nr:hypothetical protein [Stellaceae bacterium]